MREAGRMLAPAGAEVARRRFGRPGLAPLWSALRDRLERAGDAPVRRVRIGPLDATERRAVAELLGLERLPPATTSVAVDRLDRIVGERIPGWDARAVVEALGGPLTDRAAVRSAARREREALWEWLADHQQVRAEPALDDWVAALRRGGLVGGSVATTRALLERALAVLAALPADGVALPTLANRVCGDPHALDDGRRLSGIVLRAVATLRGVPVPGDADGRRRLWQDAGVACDDLSTAVLVAGLRPRDVAGPVGATLHAWADAGQACQLTLAQVRSAPALPVDGAVWVVENPSIVAEALRRFGVACPPLVCTSGWPSAAAMHLLRGLAGGGAELRYHGDLDGEGVRIAAYVAGRAGATPARMTAEDYLASARDDGPPVGRVTDAPWDARLAPAMRARGVAVPQEQVCGLLLDAIAHPDGATGRSDPTRGRRSHR